jgi:outer membrane protein assembly factor BamB
MPKTDALAGMPSNEQSDGSGSIRRWRRRRLLQASTAAALGAVAGCNTGSRDGSDTRSGTRTTERSVETSTGGDGTSDDRVGLDGEWPTAHADAANTGAVADPGPRGPPAVHWHSSVALDTQFTAAASPDGPVATQRDGTVVAYDHDGTVRWRDAHDAGFVAGPVASPDGTVVVGTLEGVVTAYAPDGSVRWTARTPDGLFPPHANDATPFRVVEDRVVLAHPHGTAIAFALDDGERVWESEIPRRCHRPSHGDGNVVFAGMGDRSSDTSTVFALDANTGRETWRTDVEGTVKIGAGVDEDAVYVGDIGGRVRALALADGSERWTVALDPEDSAWISTIPTAFADRVWVGTLSQGVYAVTEDGVQVHVDVDDPTTPAVGDGRLYVGSSEFDSSRGRANGSVLALDGDGTVAWQTETRGHTDGHVRYRDGRVVVGTDTGAVFQFDAGDGSRSWRRFERPASLPTPVVGNGALYCGNRRDAVRGYTATDGESHLWYVGFDAPTPSAPVVAEGTIVAGSAAGELVGTPPHEHADPPSSPMTRPERTTTKVHIDAPSPEPRWRTDLDGPIGDVGFADGTAYVGSGDRVVAVTVDGDVDWRTDVGGRVSAAPALADDADGDAEDTDDVLFVARDDGELLALDARDGSVRWRESVGARATAPVLVDEYDPSLVVVGTDGGVTARTAADGTERWHQAVGRLRGPPAVADDHAFAAGADGIVHALALDDGTESWAVDTGAAIHGAPAVADDTLYVGNRDRNLVAIDIVEGTVDWAFRLSDWVDGSPVVAYGAVFVTTQAGQLTAVVADPN